MSEIESVKKTNIHLIKSVMSEIIQEIVVKFDMGFYVSNLWRKFEFGL
jgi:hypothetical protein